MESRLLVAPRLLGVFPVSSGGGQVSPRWTLYSLFALAAVSLHLALVLAVCSTTVHVSWVQLLLYKCQMVSLAASMAVISLSLVLRKAAAAKLFTRLDELGSRPALHHPLITVRSYFLLQLTAIIYTACYDAYANQPLNDQLRLSLAYYYLVIAIISAGIIPFLFILQLIFGKFDLILRRMKSLKRHQTVLFDLLKLVVMYNKIANTIDDLNRIYSLQFLFVSFVSFLNVVTNLYFIIDLVLGDKDETEDRWRFVPVHLGWVVIFSFLISFPVHSCQQVVRQAKEFNILLYQLMINDKTNEITSNEKLRLHISMKRELVFTAFDFFTLDYRLLHSMLAAATTYLVILMQFGQPDSDKKCVDGKVMSNLTLVTEGSYSSTSPSYPLS